MAKSAVLTEYGTNRRILVSLDKILLVTPLKYDANTIVSEIRFINGTILVFQEPMELIKQQIDS